MGVKSGPPQDFGHGVCNQALIINYKYLLFFVLDFPLSFFLVPGRVGAN